MAEFDFPPNSQSWFKGIVRHAFPYFPLVFFNVKQLAKEPVASAIIPIEQLVTKSLLEMGLFVLDFLFFIFVFCEFANYKESKTIEDQQN
jgi:hypothetical protein